MAFLALLFPDGDPVTKIIQRVAKVAAREAVPAYLVGGAVRDRILGRPTKDIDIMVIGDGIAFARELARSFRLKRVIEYPRFGTAMVPYHELLIEVATARTERYASDSRKPTVRQGELHEDLARRDFTINALAMSLNSEDMFSLTDHYGGLKDLDAGIIRTPLDAVTTFSEDPLRMLRAIRFAGQLGFRIESRTLAAIDKVKERLKIISQERITDELVKMILVPEKPSRGFQLLRQSGLLELVLPEIAALQGVDQKNGYHHKDVFAHTLQVLDNIAQVSERLDLRFTALVHDIAKPRTKRYVEGKGWTFHGHEELGTHMIRRLCRRLKLPNKLTEFAVHLTRLHLRPIAIAEESVTDSAVRRLIVEAGDNLEDLIHLCRADVTSKNPRKVSQYMQNFDRVMRHIQGVKEKDRLRAFQSPVRGAEIMKICRLEPGPRVGYIKKAIEDAILNGELPNTYEDARRYLEENKERWLRECEGNQS